MFDCRINSDIFPKEGEIVVVKVLSISEDSVAVELLEYNNIQGIIYNSELSKKKFKTVTQVTKAGNVEVCTVVRVEEAKTFIELSLKTPSLEERQRCKEGFAKNKLVYQLMSKVAKMLNIDIKDLYDDWGFKKTNEFGSLYSYFAKAKDNLDILDNEPHGEVFKKIITEQFKPSSYKARVDVEVTCAMGGVDALKKAFLAAYDNDNTLEISLLKSPIYSIVKVSDNKEDSFNAINMASDIIKKEITKLGGTFNVVVPAQFYGEKTKHSFLDEKIEDEENSKDESD
jgi:translation initiation factor 2 subunit 1